MRHNQCLFCTSVRCSTHVYTDFDNGKTYNELSCKRHIDELYAHSDQFKGVIKCFLTSTGVRSRRYARK